MPQSLEKKKYLSELISNQLKNIQPTRRLVYKDLCRIANYIDSSIFDEDECCIWNGYVTNGKKSGKGTYINFFFRNKKVALHRLLYENFIGPLSDDCYLKFSCDVEENKGKCCNINHMVKHDYHTNVNNYQTSDDNHIKAKNESKTESDLKSQKDKFTISFD